MKPRINPRLITETLKKRKSIKLAAKDLAVSPENLIAARDGHIKKLYLQGYNKSEIARAVGLSKERVRQILASERIELSEKELYLRRFIRQYNPKIKEPKLLEEFLKRNIHRKRETLAKYLGVEEKALRNLIDTLGIAKFKKESVRAELLAWAKRQKPSNLAYGQMFKQNRRMLLKILAAFREKPGEHRKAPLKVYERFLAELGLSRKDVGMRRASAGSREEIKKRLLEYLSKPRSTASLIYPTKKKAKVTRGVASNYLIYPILRELLKSGEIKETRILGKVYYFKPGQEHAVEKLRGRAVAFALNSLKKGKTGFRFTLKDAKIAILMRLKEPLSSQELRFMKAKSGVVRLCSGKLLYSAIASLMKEGKLLSEYIGGRKYFFKPEQMEEIKRLAEEYRKAGKRRR
ncbi:MAG: hypothetical protein J7J87_04195 [Candidatus Diapherotrites archaeon]|nr:hypothetical protein [Candidatus Diapherotrites archaeon]